MAAVRTRDWLVGGLFSGGGAILHALALGLAPLSLVQPVGVLALGLTATINARYTGRRLSGAAMAAAALSTLGVTAFLVLAGSAAHANEVHHDSETAAGTMAGLAFALLAGLALLVGGWGRGLALSGAAGTAYGVSSLLLRGLTQDLSDGGSQPCSSGRWPVWSPHGPSADGACNRPTQPGHHTSRSHRSP